MKMNTKVVNLVFSTLALVLVAGCSSTATYNPSYFRSATITTVPRYQGKLLLFTSVFDDSYIFQGHPESFTGSAWNLNVPLGEFSKKMSGEIYGHLFDEGYESVNVIDPNNAQHFAAIIHPHFEDLAWRMNQAKNAGFAITPQVKLTLNLQLLSDTNTVVFERQYESGWVDGNTYFMNLSPMETVNVTVHKTMANLMEDSMQDLDAVLRNTHSSAQNPNTKSNLTQ
jgi:hypothetical protein